MYQAGGIAIQGNQINYAAEGKLSLFGDVNQQITGAMGRIISATAQATHIADSLYGSEPQAAAKPSSTLTTTSVSRETETRNNLAALHDAISSLEYQINRLNTLP